MENPSEPNVTEVIVVYNPELGPPNDDAEKVLYEFFGRHFFIIHPVTKDIDIITKSDFHEAGGRVEIGYQIDEDTKDKIEESFILPGWN